jgi:hypothetical protein
LIVHLSTVPVPCTWRRAKKQRVGKIDRKRGKEELKRVEIRKKMMKQKVWNGMGTIGQEWREFDRIGKEWRNRVKLRGMERN